MRKKKNKLWKQKCYLEFSWRVIAEGFLLTLFLSNVYVDWLFTVCRHNCYSEWHEKFEIETKKKKKNISPRSVAIVSVSSPPFFFLCILFYSKCSWIDIFHDCDLDRNLKKFSSGKVFCSIFGRLDTRILFTSYQRLSSFGCIHEKGGARRMVRSDWMDEVHFRNWILFSTHAKDEESVGDFQRTI